MCKRDRLTHAAVKSTNELSFQRQVTGEEAGEGVNGKWTCFRNAVREKRSGKDESSLLHVNTSSGTHELVVNDEYCDEYPNNDE